MNKIKEFVVRFPLPVFFGLAYAFSWFPSLFEAHGILPIGPFFAALTVLGFIGKDQLKDFLRHIVLWRVNIGWYALVLLLPVFVTVVAAGINVGLGAHLQTVAAPLASDVIGTAIFILIMIGLGEEPAWRGFALPRLLKGRSILTASLFLAILHIIWHLPLFGLEYDSTNILPWSLTIFAYTIITTWMYNRTSGSLLLPALFHTSVNVSAKYLFIPFFTGADMIQLWWLWFGIWWVVAIIVLATNAKANVNQPEFSNA
jgi:membrane protease YdiL (CAAX protease family)